MVSTSLTEEGLSVAGIAAHSKNWRLERMAHFAEREDAYAGAVAGIRVPLTGSHLEVHVEHPGMNRAGRNTVVVERDWCQGSAGVPSAGRAV